MDRPYSFQDELARSRAERETLGARAEGKAGYERMLAYRAGQAAGADIIGRALGFGSTYERNTRTLRTAAAAQPGTLAGRVAAAELVEAADRNEQDTPDTQAEVRRLAALERLQHAAAERISREAAMQARSQKRE